MLFWSLLGTGRTRALGTSGYSGHYWGGRSQDLASENREIFQPTLSECKSGRERAPGRPLKPLEPPRIAGRPGRQSGRSGAWGLAGCFGRALCIGRKRIERINTRVNLPRISLREMAPGPQNRQPDQETTGKRHCVRRTESLR